MPSIPKRFDKYQVKEILGEGAMGIVYSGHDPSIGRDVAIKTTHAHLLKGRSGEDLRKRFALEIKAVGKMSHPNIVAIYDTDDIVYENGIIAPYFVMEYVKGKKLKHYLANHQSFTLRKTLAISGQILDAFSYTHKHHIIHRDIKPGNIFITDDGQVKISDFGIARMDNSNMTQTGTVIGTPNYMSPEQCTGQPADERSDLFSIAIVVYEMLTGQQPFYAKNIPAVMMNVIQSNPEPPSVLNPGLPKELDDVLAKALAKAPEDRFQTADEFKQALMSAGKGQRTGKHATVAPERARRKRNSSGTMEAKSLSRPSKRKKRIENLRKLRKLKNFNWTMALWIAGPLIVGVIGYSFTSQPADQETSLAYLESIPMESLPAYANDLSPVQQSQVDSMLGTAADHENSGRYVWPKTANAALVYGYVLETDPGNPRALHGLKIIEARLVEEGETLYARKDYDSLANQLILLKTYFPDSPSVSEWQQELEQNNRG